MPKYHHNGKGFKMSIIWLVGLSDPWLEELHVVLSGVAATRRITSLKSLARIHSMGEADTHEKFLLILQLTALDSEMAVHSLMSKFIQDNHTAKVCCIGPVTKEQKTVLDALKIDSIERPQDLEAFAKFSRTLLLGTRSGRVGGVVCQDYIRFGDVEVDLPSGVLKVLATGVREPVTPKEIGIIKVLAQCLNGAVAREDLVKKVWPGLRVSASTVDSHMSRLRKKIEQSFECRIETAYGSGWTLSVRSQTR